MASKVTILRLVLSNFRNYGALSLRFDGRHVVLTGDNGSGKTNLLEAISFLSPGRGLRRAVYGDAVREGQDQGFTIFSELEGMEGEVEIGTGVGAGPDAGSLRKVRINGTEMKSADELLNHLRILWLTPSMDGLFTGPASDRRRFLDRLVLSLDPTHGRRAADFEKAMKMRNRLLEDGKPDETWLSGLEQQMAELGIAMTIARNEMLSLIAQLGDMATGNGAFPSARLRLEGFLDDAAGLPALDLEERYLALLREGRWRDQAAGRTLQGPHRVDLLVDHSEKNMDAARCSTGEQKALLTGLILAHARLTASLTGYAPVLLLDEIAAHFDEKRRAALFDLIEELGGQAFMTGTDRQLFNALGSRAQYFSVSAGALTPID
ncbi:DNA replication/repair protein RecF [Rhizobium alvei]|uniref:DNA replication and repair protein RecF n=1 Tax=Rhizobium alvei TaxID=1132659 RepID=A0ABT8YR94_9HYPH|nr:DNA replication/repair protein RecF [Rhizobium alvei]MDO6966256.1 DNA replication/repair protein RecF [Rhizobium alvei]